MFSYSAGEFHSFHHKKDAVVLHRRVECASSLRTVAINEGDQLGKTSMNRKEGQHALRILLTTVKYEFNGKLMMTTKSSAFIGTQIR